MHRRGTADSVGCTVVSRPFFEPALHTVKRWAVPQMVEQLVVSADEVELHSQRVTRFRFASGTKEGTGRRLAFHAQKMQC